MPVRLLALRVALLLVALCLVTGHARVGAQGAPQLPAPQGRVNDFANLLDDATEAAIDQQLGQVEDRTTAEIAVVTVASLQGLTVEDFAERLFRTWGIGQEKLDNGVLVLVAPEEREMRIEVGYGLEGVLPDGLAGEIIRVSFLPRFRENDYQGGIVAGVGRVAEIVERNHVLSPEERRAIEEATQDRAPMWLTVPFFGVFVGVGAFMAGIGLGGKVGFPLIFGALFGGIPLLMSLVPFFNAPIWILGPWGAVLGWLGFRQGRRTPGWVRDMRNEVRAATAATATAGSSASTTGWVMGGTSDSSDSGSSSSSGDSGSRSSSDSSGGGSSGGGGASGSW